MKHSCCDQSPNFSFTNQYGTISAHHRQFISIYFKQLSFLSQTNDCLCNEYCYIHNEHEGCKRQAFENRTTHFDKHVKIILFSRVFYLPSARQEQNFMLFHISEVLYSNTLKTVITSEETRASIVLCRPCSAINIRSLIIKSVDVHLI